MKKSLLSIAFALLGITNGFAAKAYPGPITVIQSDGTKLTVYLHGDENFNWSTTEDGALLTQVGKGYYIAETTSTGTLKATKYLAHNANMRLATEAKAIKKQNIQLFLNSTNQKSIDTKATRSIGTGYSNVKYFPHTGSPKALVILAEFSDTTFVSGKNAKNVFEHFLRAKGDEELPAGYEAYTGSYKHSNLRNYGSVSEYFYDMSQGAFTPQFDVVGPYNLGKPSLYYGKGKYDNGSQLVKDACTAAYANGVDFSQYDSDGDGDVDLVYIIYAGYPASMSGNDDDIWPKAMNNTNAGSFNGKNVKLAGIHAERSYGWAANKDNGYLLSGIGLFCHEFSHTMGLPDLYPDDNHQESRVDNQEPEMWDLMDGGEYTYNGGYCPTPYSPWEMDAMGWMTPTELTDQAKQVTLTSFSNSKERIAYKINGENNEYLLLQNIQPEGWWSKLCNKYNHGLLIWRIDYDNKDVNSFDYPNNKKGKPKVTIVPADNYIISAYQVKDEDNPSLPWSQTEYDESLKGDPFPGTQNVTKLLSVELNNSTLEKPLYNIKEEDGTITFDYLKDFATGIDRPAIDRDTEKDAPIYTLDGRYVGTAANQLTKGIYIIGKKKVVIK